MKIRTQDCNRYVEFGECFVEMGEGGAIIWIRSPYGGKTVVGGVYEDIPAARGVMSEMDWAYRLGRKIFYMP